MAPDPPAAVQERCLEIQGTLPRAAVAWMQKGCHGIHAALCCPVADPGGGLAGEHMSPAGLDYQALWQKANPVHHQCDHSYAAADHVLLDHWARGSVAPYMWSQEITAARAGERALEHSALESLATRE